MITRQILHFSLWVVQPEVHYFVNNNNNNDFNDFVLNKRTNRLREGERKKKNFYDTRFDDILNTEKKNFPFSLTSGIPPLLHFKDINGKTFSISCNGFFR